ncbi:MAG TPA: phosphate ABC transporter substrate-binding protein PstS [Pseudomonas sp.]|jgi:phosphate transport system substrate-binding protein
MITFCLGLTLSLGALGNAGATEEIVGAGSTFVFPVLSKWADEYNRKTGVRVNYQSIGSGAGLAQVKAAAVDFGASDRPLDSGELAASGMIQFPLVSGGIVPVMNLPAIAPGSLKFTGALLADIFMGKITQWNDPAIAALNPTAALPKKPITVVYRSDNSGTSYNWASYLARVSEHWKATVGEGASVKWPVGLGAKGSEGVASYVKQMPYSIGYIEYAYSRQHQLNYALVQNKAGNYVAPDLTSFQAAAAGADWSNARDFNVLMVNAEGESAYPITATTFIVMPRQVAEADRRAAVQAFFKWALEQGQPQATALDFAPLPESLVKQIEAYWADSQLNP